MHAVDLKINDDALWAETPPDQQKRVLFLRRLFREAMEATKPRQKLQELWPQAKSAYGLSWRRFEAIYYSVRSGESWTAMLDQRAAKFALDKGMPHATREHWHACCLKHQRKCKKAWKAMLEDWRNGQNIPGIGSWTDAWRKKHKTAPPHVCPSRFVPHGLTYSTCMRNKPKEHDLALVRIGTSAADANRPLILTTRKGIEAGQVYLFDDIVHDNQVVHFGAAQNKPFRPIELDCLDLASGYLAGWFLLREHEDIETGEVVANIRQKHMRFFVAHVLMDSGYRKAGTILIDEHRTAHIPEEVESYLSDITDGAVRVNRSGIEGEAVLRGMFGEAPRGNFRFKAALESLRNLQHNELDALPGQTGKDRFHAPAEAYGRKQAHGALMRALLQLPPRLRQALFEMFALGYCTFNEFAQILGETYARIGDRRDHDLEGWEACGYYEKQFVPVPDADGIPLAQIMAQDEAQRAGVVALMQLDPARYTRIEKLSPRMVWDRRAGTERLPWWHMPAIVGRENAYEWTLGKDYVFFRETHPILGGGPHAFVARIVTPTGQRTMLRAEETYLTYASPISPDHLIVCDAKNTVLGRCERMPITNRLDHEGMAKATEQTAIAKALLRQGVKGHLAQEAAQQIADRNLNRSLIEAAKDVAKGTPDEAPSPAAAAPPSTAQDYSKQIV